MNMTADCGVSSAVKQFIMIKGVKKFCLAVTVVPGPNQIN